MPLFVFGVSGAGGGGGGGGTADVIAPVQNGGPITLTVTNETIVPCNTNGGTVTVGLPLATVGRRVEIKDVGYTASTNNILITNAGSDQIEQLGGADASSFVISADRGSLPLICLVTGRWSIL